MTGKRDACCAHRPPQYVGRGMDEIPDLRPLVERTAVDSHRYRNFYRCRVCGQEWRECSIPFHHAMVTVVTKAGVRPTLEWPKPTRRGAGSGQGAAKPDSPWEETLRTWPTWENTFFAFSSVAGLIVGMRTMLPPSAGGLTRAAWGTGCMFVGLFGGYVMAKLLRWIYAKRKKRGTEGRMAAGSKRAFPRS